MPLPFIPWTRFSLLLIFLFTSFFVQSQTVMYVTSEILEVKSGPSASSSTISELSQGDKITMNNVSNDWASITFWTRNGFVPYRYLSTQQYGNANASPVASSQTYTQPKPVAKQENIVIICNSENAYAYHTNVCRGLARCTHGMSKVTVSDAVKLGYVPCQNCY